MKIPIEHNEGEPSAGDAEEGQPSRPLEELEGEVEELAKEEEAKLHYDRWLRARAELENFRKRMERLREEDRERAAEHLVLQLLPVLDDLEKAAGYAVGGGDVAAVQEGINHVLNSLKGVLEREGLTAIQAVGEPFDPAVHEAVQVVEAEDGMSGRVVEELQRGYMWKGKLLRPTRVAVGAEKDFQQ